MSKVAPSLTVEPPSSSADEKNRTSQQTTTSVVDASNNKKRDGLGCKVRICGVVDTFLSIAHIVLATGTMWLVIKGTLLDCLIEHQSFAMCDRFHPRIIFWGGIVVIMIFSVELMINYDLLCATWSPRSKDKDTCTTAKLWGYYNLFLIIVASAFFVMTMQGLKWEFQLKIASGTLILLGPRLLGLIVVFMYAKGLARVAPDGQAGNVTAASSKTVESQKK